MLLGVSLYGDYQAYGDLYPYLILLWLLVIELAFLRHLNSVYKSSDKSLNQPDSPTLKREDATKSPELKAAHIELEMATRPGRISTTERNSDEKGIRDSKKWDFEDPLGRASSDSANFRNVSLDSPTKDANNDIDIFDELNQVETMEIDQRAIDAPSEDHSPKLRKSHAPKDADKDKHGALGRKSQLRSFARQLTKRDFSRRKNTQQMIDFEKLGIKPKMEKIFEGYQDKNDAEDEENEANYNQIVPKQGPINIDKFTHRDLKSFLIKDMSFDDKKRLIHYYKRYNLVSMINTRLGLIMLVERLLLLMVFISSNSKRNLFSILNLTFAIYYWYRSKSFYYVRPLTNFFALMTLIQTPHANYCSSVN